MKFRVLRPHLELVGDDGGLVSISQPTHRGTICALVLCEDQPLPRTDLMELLWAHPVAGGRLRTRIYEVRQVIGKHRLVWDGAAYRFSLGTRDWCDLTEFRKRAREAEQALDRQDRELAAHLFEQAVGLWHEQPLQDIPDTPAALEAAASVTEEMRNARDTVVALRTDLEQFQGLIGPLTAITGAEPTNEEAWGYLMLALYRCGRQAEALHAYNRARRALQDANIQPDEHLRQLRRQIQARDPALGPPAFSPPNSDR